MVGVTANRLDLPSLTPLSVAGEIADPMHVAGELPYWGNSVALPHVFDNWPHKQWWWILLCGTPGHWRVQWISAISIFLCYLRVASTAKSIIRLKRNSCQSHRTVKTPFIFWWVNCNKRMVDYSAQAGATKFHRAIEKLCNSHLKTFFAKETNKTLFI